MHIHIVIEELEFKHSGCPKFETGKTVPKQRLCEHRCDAGGFKARDAHEAENQLLSHDVYIVYLHGFLGCAHDWEEVISVTGWPKSYALPLPLELESFPGMLDHLEIERCHLVGYSMGGRIAMQLQAKYPDRISRLALLGAHFGIEDIAEKEKRGEEDLKWADRLRTLPIKEFLDFWYAQPLFREFSVPQRRSEIDPHYHAQLLETYSLAKLPFLEPPSDTLLLCGENDHKYRALYRNPILISNAGHAAHIENPAGVAEVLARMFLLPEKQIERYPL